MRFEARVIFRHFWQFDEWSLFYVVLALFRTLIKYWKYYHFRSFSSFRTHLVIASRLPNGRFQFVHLANSFTSCWMLFRRWLWTVGSPIREAGHLFENAIIFIVSRHFVLIKSSRLPNGRFQFLHLANSFLSCWMLFHRWLWLVDSPIREAGYLSLMVPSDILPYLTYQRRVPSFVRHVLPGLSFIVHCSAAYARIFIASRMLIGCWQFWWKFSIWHSRYVGLEWGHVSYVFCLRIPPFAICVFKLQSHLLSQF